MTKHTAGPWHRNIKPARKYNTIFAGRNTHVARLATEGLSEGEIEANCSLITAAPELLAALNRIIEWVDAGCDPSVKSLENARAAIAKAKGE